MRKLLIALGVCVVLVAIALLGLAVSLNRLLSGQRERLLQAAEAALGRRVQVDAITVSLWGGLGARLDHLRVADDPQFGDADVVDAAALTARVHLLPLLWGHVDVSRLDLQQPQIRLIRDAAGRWNYATLKPLQVHSAPTAAPDSFGVRPASTAAPASAAPGFALLVAHASVADGTVIITDHMRTPVQTTRATHLDLGVDDISAVSAIRFVLDVAVQGEERNVHLEGRLGPITAQPTSLDLGGSLGPLGPQHVRIDAFELAALLAPEAVQVSSLAGRALGGTFQLSGTYPLRPGGEGLLKGQLADIRVASLLAINGSDLAKRMDGAAQVVAELRCPGLALPALSGTVVADVTDGVIKDFNLVDEVVGRLTGLPGIGNLVSANVKPKYGRLFAESQTRFERLHVSFDIADERLRTDDLAVVATDYGVQGSGWVGFDRKADLAGRLFMSKRFSDDLVADVKEAKYALDENGQLMVPFRLRGRLGEAKPRPDSDYLIALLSRALERGAVKGLVDKLLGGPKPPAPGETPAANPLEQGLRKLFGR